MKQIICILLNVLIFVAFVVALYCISMAAGLLIDEMLSFEDDNSLSDSSNSSAVVDIYWEQYCKSNSYIEFFAGCSFQGSLIVVPTVISIGMIILCIYKCCKKPDYKMEEWFINPGKYVEEYEPFEKL